MMTLGGLLFGTALLALGRAALVFRRPSPPAWTTGPLVGELVAVALVAWFAAGLGSLGAGAVVDLQTGASLPDLVAFGAVSAGSFMLWRQMKVGKRLRAMERGRTARLQAARRRSAPAETTSVGMQPVDRAA